MKKKTERKKWSISKRKFNEAIKKSWIDGYDHGVDAMVERSSDAGDRLKVFSRIAYNYREYKPLDES